MVTMDSGRAMPAAIPATAPAATPAALSAALLALLYGASGVLAVAGAVWPAHRDTPVELLWAIGATGLAGGALLRALAGRVPEWLLHAAVLLASGLVSVLAWRSATAVGIVGLGPAVLTLGLYAAHFFPLRIARGHVAVLMLGATWGAWAARPSGFLLQWVVLLVSVAAITEAHGRFTLRLRTAAATDPLTGVANRRAWEAEAERNLAHAARTGEPVSFAILDLDDFKEVNDSSGHGAGDTLLRELTTGWSGHLRGADLLGRYGGDEFVLCLPATDQQGTRELLDRLADTHPFAWSAGTAVAGPGDTLGSVLARADADLYSAKRAGRS
jgi:diguanylate cyclase (GGDEF)-like protein